MPSCDMAFGQQGKVETLIVRFSSVRTNRSFEHVKLSFLNKDWIPEYRFCYLNLFHMTNGSFVFPEHTWHSVRHVKIDICEIYSERAQLRSCVSDLLFWRCIDLHLVFSMIYRSCDSSPVTRISLRVWKSLRQDLSSSFWNCCSALSKLDKTGIAPNGRTHSTKFRFLWTPSIHS